MNYVPFLKWLLVVCATILGSYFAYDYGFFEMLYVTDMTYLSWVVMGVFALMSVRCGVLTFKHCYEKSGT